MQSAVNENSKLIDDIIIASAPIKKSKKYLRAHISIRQSQYWQQL